MSRFPAESPYALYPCHLQEGKLILKDNCKYLTQLLGYHNVPKHPTIKWVKTGRFRSKMKTLSSRYRCWDLSCRGAGATSAGCPQSQSSEEAAVANVKRLTFSVPEENHHIWTASHGSSLMTLAGGYSCRLQQKVSQRLLSSQLPCL